MKRAFLMMPLLMMTAASAAFAEFRQIDLSIFGMD